MSKKYAIGFIQLHNGELLAEDQLFWRLERRGILSKNIVYVKWRIEVDGFSQDDHLNIDITYQEGPLNIFLAMVLRRNDFQFLRARLLRWSPTDSQPARTLWLNNPFLRNIDLANLAYQKCLALVILSNDCFGWKIDFPYFSCRELILIRRTRD